MRLLALGIRYDLRRLRWWTWWIVARGAEWVYLRATVRAMFAEPWVDVEPDWEDRSN